MSDGKIILAPNVFRGETVSADTTYHAAARLENLPKFRQNQLCRGTASAPQNYDDHAVFDESYES